MLCFCIKQLLRKKYHALNVPQCSLALVANFVSLLVGAQQVVYIAELGFSRFFAEKSCKELQGHVCVNDSNLGGLIT